MTDHPITPPPELRDVWDNLPLSTKEIFVVAAQWGADQELEACCEAIKDRKWFGDPSYRIAELRAARRPKPLSLKEQALRRLDNIHPFGDDKDIIRRALEALPE